MITPQFNQEAPADSVKDLGNRSNFENLVLSNKRYFTMLLYRFVETSSNILSTSKGRNTICSLIQYQAKLVYSCNINSNIPEVMEIVM